MDNFTLLIIILSIVFLLVLALAGDSIYKGHLLKNLHKENQELRDQANKVAKHLLRP